MKNKTTKTQTGKEKMTSALLKAEIELLKYQTGMLRATKALRLAFTVQPVH